MIVNVINTVQLKRPAQFESRLEAIQRRVGLSVRPLAKRLTGGTLHELVPFFDQLEQYLSPEDYMYFMDICAAAFRSPWKDTRSTVFSLSKPWDIDGKIFRGLRLKGSFPRTIEHNSETNIMPYCAGKGFVPFSFDPVADGIFVREIDLNNNLALEACGTMRRTSLDNEISTACAAKRVTDKALGFNIFNNLQYFGEGAGLAIYAMEDCVDLRLFMLLVSSPRSSHAKSHLLKAGRALRVFHALLPLEERRVHGFPHSGNFRISDYAGTKLVDLDTATRLMSLPEEARLPFICLDLARAFNDIKDIEHSFQFFSGYLGGRVRLAKGWEYDMIELGGLYSQMLRSKGKVVKYEAIIDRFSPNFCAWLMKDQ
ncbi:MAG: hypothetical protein WC890_00795 [Candidatus Margulisiibacteriota bacterium]